MRIQLFVLAMLLVFAAIISNSVLLANDNQAYAETGVSSQLRSAGKISFRNNGSDTWKTWSEGWLGVNGETAYCIDSTKSFSAGSVTAVDLLSYVSQEKLTDAAVRIDYIWHHYSKNYLSDECKYALSQCVMWQTILDDGSYWVTEAPNGGFSELTEGVEWDVFSSAAAYSAENAHKYLGYGTAWINGNTQPLATIGLLTKPGYIAIEKQSANTSITNGINSYSLETGATYGIYSDAACSSLVETLTTGTDKKAISNALEVGTYYVKEISAPKGYELSEKVYTANVTAGATTYVGESGVAYDEPASDSIFINLSKYVDEIAWSESGNASLGNTSLKGAQYVVKYFDSLDYSSKDLESLRDSSALRSWVFETDKDGFIDLSDASQLVSGLSDSLYYDTDGAVTFPLGTYVIYETKAPEGYLLSNATYGVRVVQGADGKATRISLNEGGFTYVSDTKTYIGDGETPIRGDIEFIKDGLDTMKRFANCVFRLTSETTGESHILVTDENGYFSSEASWNAHTSNTNANDAAVAADGTVDESLLDSSAGVWFGQYIDSSGNTAITNVRDDRGALPYDYTYTLEELRCSANEGYTLVKIPSISISRDGALVKLGNIDNELIPEEPKPSIQTYAYDAKDDDKLVDVGKEATIIDTVSYSNLEVGKTYTLTGCLMKCAQDAEGVWAAEEYLDASGNPAKSEVTFVAKASAGTVDVEFVFNCSNLKTDDVLTVYESLIYAGEEIASHKIAGDEGQSVTFMVPEIGTSLTDTSDGDHLILPSSEISVVDAIAYKNLTAGKEYTIKGYLMEKSTGDVLVVNDEEVTASTTFVAEAESGTTAVKFTFDASALSDDTSLVAFEYLYFEDEIIAEHADLDYEGQTVTVSTPPETPDTPSEPEPTPPPLAKTYDKTGEVLSIIGILALLGLSVCAAAYGVSAWRRRAGR